MASWLFRKRVKALPGVFINISRHGFGLGIGPRGANVSLNRKGIYANTGLPSSGIYRRDKLASWNDVKNNIQSKKIQQNQKNQITSTISKARQKNPKVIKNQSYITLIMNDQKRIIVNNFTFGRNECKSSFKHCNEVYTKQLTVLKDKGGEWFIQGLQVPKSAKNKDRDTLKFYRTLYNGKDITNIVIKMVDNGEIQIGTTTIRTTINYKYRVLYIRRHKGTTSIFSK